MLDLLNAMFSLTVCWPDIAEIRGVRISQGCFMKLRLDGFKSNQ